MAEMFRMTVVRDPLPASLEHVISLQTFSPTQSAMMAAARSETRNRTWSEIATRLVDGTAISESVFASETLLEQVMLLFERSRAKPTVDEIAAILSNAIGDTQVPQWIEVVDDWLVALAVLRRTTPLTFRLGRFRRGLRILEVMRGVTPNIDDVQWALTAPLQLPAWLDLDVPVPPESEPIPNPELEAASARVQELETEWAAIGKLRGEVARIGPKLDVEPSSATMPQPLIRVPRVTAAVRARIPAEARETLRRAGIEDDVDLHEVVRKTEVYASVKRQELGKARSILKKTVGSLPTMYYGKAGGPLKPKKPTPISIIPPNPYVDPLAIKPSKPLPLYRVGVGDLFIVKNVLKGYGAGEVSRIENVLRGETRSREVRILNRVEETLTLGAESETVDEKSLESTARNELQVESSATLKEQQNLKAGVGLSAQLGPVNLRTGVDYTWDKAREESKKAVAKSSREVVEKAVSKITERVKEERTSKMLRETEEKQFQSFDNTGATNKHIAGVYQWVDKLYEVQVWKAKDGPYTMYDVLIPEPATRLLREYTSLPKLPPGVVEPPEFTLGLDEITEEDFDQLVETWGSDGVRPPPDPYIYIGTSIAIQNAPTVTDGDKRTETTPLAQVTKELKVPPGYSARAFRVESANSLETPGMVADLNILVGHISRKFSTAPDATDMFYLDSTDETQAFEETVPIALVGYKVKAAAANVSALCQRKDSALAQWRLDTWNTFRATNDRRRAAYNDAVNVTLLSSPQVPSNSEENRRTIETELRRGVVALLTRQSFTAFGALYPPGVKNYDSEINFARASVQMPFVRFFEDAFEWEQVSFFCYPYFWGEREMGRERLRISESDPMFGEFLRAGAVRVIVPVKKGKEATVEAALAGTSKPWEAEPTSVALSTMSADIVAEMRMRDSPTHEATLEDRWEVRVPTSFTLLREDDKLPNFTPDGDDYRPSDP